MTRAFDVEGEEYGDAAARVDRTPPGKTPEGVVDGLLKDVKAFAGEATQNDDLTLVIVSTGRGMAAAGYAWHLKLLKRQDI